ncbi:MAG: glycosyltransferase family 39 protein, partial [Bacteroidota bacterium]
MGLNTELDLAWEYGERMRPGLQPGMVVMVQRFFAVFGLDNPFLVARFFRILSAAFSFWVTLLLWQVYRDRWSNMHVRWAFFLLSFFLWFSFYNGVRFNSELWSANFFALAVVGQCRWEKPSRQQNFLLGGLLGLSFLFRYQAAFMIAGYGLWLLFIKREEWSRTASFTLGGLALASVGIIIDRWFYGEWVFSTWHYFEQNILLDKASNFGVDPWWKYFEDMIIKGIPPFGLFYLLAMLLYFWLRPRDLLTWISIPFIGIHLLIAHKELRFFYVLLPYLPIAIATVLQWWTDRRGKSLWASRSYRVGWRFFWLHNALLTLFIAFWPVINEMKIYQAIYDQYPEPISIYGLDD